MRELEDDLHCIHYTTLYILTCRSSSSFTAHITHQCIVYTRIN